MAEICPGTMRMMNRPAFHGPSLVTVSAKGTVFVKEIRFSMRRRPQNRMSAILRAYRSSLRSRRLHFNMKLSRPAYSEKGDQSVLMDGQRPTLNEVCNGLAPQNLLDRAQELGFESSTQTQVEALPVVMEGGDCLLQAQTGSGKTLAYLLPLLAKVAPRSAVQGIVVVPTRELGMQVAKVARALVGKALNTVLIQPYSSYGVGAGGLRCGGSSDSSGWSQSRVFVAKDQGENVAVGSGEGNPLRFLLGTLAASFILFDFSISATAFAAVGDFLAAPDEKQIPGIDPLSTKPGLVERLIEKTKANKAKYDQERLDNYYRRNYKDYFDFLKGQIVNKDPQKLTEAERGILKWLEKNS